MSNDGVQWDFSRHHKDTRAYLEWTKALDDYGVVWSDATESCDVLVRLELGRGGDKLYLLGPHQVMDDPLSLDDVEIAPGQFAYVGNRNGYFGLLSDKKVLTEARLVWCNTCSQSYFGTTESRLCPLCGDYGWTTEAARLTWFGYPGIVKFHPLRLSWYEHEPGSTLGLDSIATERGAGGKNDLFDDAEARQAGEMESGQWAKLKRSLSGAARVHGWPEARLVDELARSYPTFAEVCEFVLSEIALAPHRKAKQMRIPNLLIIGGPSSGKSSFCRRLAQILAPGDWERVDLGQSPSGFELAGSDSGYNRSKEGRVLRLLASTSGSAVRNPVLILDELDKVDDEMRYSPLPALLSLLEKSDAVRFRDAFFGIPVDASGIQFLATANDRYRIKGPLASRFETFTVADYSLDEFVNVVLPNIYAEWCAQFHKGTFPAELSQLTRKHIAELAGFVPRRVQAVLVSLANQRFREFLPAPTFESLDFKKDQH